LGRFPAKLHFPIRCHLHLEHPLECPDFSKLRLRWVSKSFLSPGHHTEGLIHIGICFESGPHTLITVFHVQQIRLQRIPKLQRLQGRPRYRSADLYAAVAAAQLLQDLLVLVGYLSLISLVWFGVVVLFLFYAFFDSHFEKKTLGSADHEKVAAGRVVSFSSSSSRFTVWQLST